MAINPYNGMFWLACEREMRLQILETLNPGQGWTAMDDNVLRPDAPQNLAVHPSTRFARSG